MVDRSDGESGRAKGGFARAAALTATERSESARTAAKARWAATKEVTEEEYELSEDQSDEIEPDAAMPVARWRGTLNIIGLEVPCYVLDNGARVIGRTSAAEVLSGIKGGGSLEQYLRPKAIEPFINNSLVLDQFVPFRLPEVEGLRTAVKGLPAELFIQICQGFVAALQASFDPKSPHPRMTDRQRQVAIHASVFLSACAKVGLEALIDEATGYQYERAEDALQVKLRAFIAEELRAWEKTFPDELWMEFGRLTGWKGALHSRPKYWGRLVTEMIYDTLDPDVANYLKNNKPAPGVHWHRQLTESLGVRSLVSRCYEVIGMAKTCSDMRELRNRVAQHYGRQVIQLTLSLPKPSPEDNPSSA